jgi:subfamily B ATP-binding cassette protein HlyB/CyaB
MGLESISAIWSGELILLARRQGHGESLQQKFDISWFIPSLVKYRKIFAKVLIASFFLQLFALITPLLRHRLNDKFKHGAANTAFLTKSITGIGAVKSMVVEPQMQRKREDHRANYVPASFRSQNLNNAANQVAGLINELMTLGVIWWGAHLVIANELTIGQLVAFEWIREKRILRLNTKQAAGKELPMIRQR